MSKCYLKMKAHLFPILTLRELTNRQKYLQNRQMLSGRKEQHILFMDKNHLQYMLWLTCSLHLSTTAGGIPTVRSLL